MKENASPLVSVVTVTYNAAKLLPATLNSLNQQKFRDFEHIVVDGASSDDTLAVVRSLSAGSRILSEPDRGLYDAMNKGLRLASGQYVIFLNAGDSLRGEDALGRYAAACGDDTDIIYADTMIVDSAGNDLRPRHLSVPAVLTKESFSHGMLICHQAFMARRSLVPKFDLSYRFSADYDWTLKCIEATDPGRCRNLKRVAVNFLDEGTTKNNKLASLRERFDVMRRHFGTTVAVARHLSFIPRALRRHL